MLDFYRKIFFPYRGEIEAWYVENQKPTIYLSAVLLSVRVILVRNPHEIWNVFRGLTRPPDMLQKALNSWF